MVQNAHIQEPEQENGIQKIRPLEVNLEEGSENVDNILSKSNAASSKKLDATNDPSILDENYANNNSNTYDPIPNKVIAGMYVEEPLQKVEDTLQFTIPEASTQDKLPHHFSIQDINQTEDDSNNKVNDQQMLEQIKNEQEEQNMFDQIKNEEDDQ